MRARIGHAHIKVRDLDRAIDFYTRFLGLRVTERVGDRWAFLSGSELHHELALQSVGRDAPIPSRDSTGLFHVAFEVPDRRSFALAYRGLQDQGVPTAIVDHRISWAIYFSDPDSNGVEIYWDTRNQADGDTLWSGDDRSLSPDKVLAALDEEAGGR